MALGHRCDEYNAAGKSYPLNSQAKKAADSVFASRPNAEGKVKKRAVLVDRAFLPFFCGQQLDY
ncbi:hypothetical protein [Klebsiella sp. H-Nf2]|uniref:hypothetical protein n=1 Tax=Klebsiella sp. H-Nf2 TaxID=2054599 RepID=UPI0010560FAE|nr:hypothetical protein [Klebsiella sp. H-Nf2]